MLEEMHGVPAHMTGQTMRICNLHEDIAAEFRERMKDGKRIAFRRDHMNRLRQGEILTSACACWFQGEETYDEMVELIRLCGDEIQKRSKLILSPEDLSETNEEPEFFLSVEGMCGIQDHPKRRIRELYALGVRMASLTWNEMNLLGSGVDGDPIAGLSKMGKKIVKAMTETGMIIDVSHDNEHTFWDILRVSQKPVLASHSNCRSLCNAERNLTDQQIVALAEKGGVIGLNAFGKFISEDPEKQGARTLAKHARHIASIVGHEHIACGFDFTDYLEEYKDIPKHDLSGAENAQNFPAALKEEGFAEEEILDIAYRNAYRFLKENL